MSSIRLAGVSFILFGTVLGALAAKDEPQRFKALKQAYQAALDRDQGTLHAAYKAELMKMKEAFSSGGDLESAMTWTSN